MIQDRRPSRLHLQGARPALVRFHGFLEIVFLACCSMLSSEALSNHQTSSLSLQVEQRRWLTLSRGFLNETNKVAYPITQWNRCDLARGGSLVDTSKDTIAQCCCSIKVWGVTDTSTIAKNKRVKRTSIDHLLLYWPTEIALWWRVLGRSVLNESSGTGIGNSDMARCRPKTDNITNIKGWIGCQVTQEVVVTM